MQIMNVNPASLFQGQTRGGEEVSQGDSVVNHVSLPCVLGWGFASFLSYHFSVCFSFSFRACIKEQAFQWSSAFLVR